MTSKTKEKAFSLNDEERGWMLKAIINTFNEVVLLHEKERLEQLYHKYESGYTPTRSEWEDDMSLLDSFYI